MQVPQIIKSVLETVAKHPAKSTGLAVIACIIIGTLVVGIAPSEVHLLPGIRAGSANPPAVVEPVSAQMTSASTSMNDTTLRQATKIKGGVVLEALNKVSPLIADVDMPIISDFHTSKVRTKDGEVKSREAIWKSQTGNETKFLEQTASIEPLFLK